MRTNGDISVTDYREGRKRGRKRGRERDGERKRGREMKGHKECERGGGTGIWMERKMERGQKEINLHTDETQLDQQQWQTSL